MKFKRAVSMVISILLCMTVMLPMVGTNALADYNGNGTQGSGSRCTNTGSRGFGYNGNTQETS